MSPGNLRKLERQLNLVALLLSENLPQTFEQIREHIDEYTQSREDAALRMFERDKDDLRKMGVPIETVSKDPLSDEQNAYRIDRRRFALPAVRLSPDETLLLQVLGAGVRADAGFPLRRALRSALTKLSCRIGLDLLYDDGDDVPLRLTGVVPPEQSGAAYIEPLIGAARRRKYVTLQYYSLHQQSVDTRTVSPYGLFSLGSAWYLVGWCHLRCDIRVFRLSRIRSLEVNARSSATPDFEVPDGFDLRHHIRPQPWAMGEAEPQTVVVRFSGEARWQVEEVLRKLGTTVEVDPQTVRWTVEVRELPRFCLWLLAFGPGAQIEAPPEAIAVVRALTERLRNRYAIQPGETS